MRFPVKVTVKSVKGASLEIPSTVPLNLKNSFPGKRIFHLTKKKLLITNFHFNEFKFFFYKYLLITLAFNTFGRMTSTRDNFNKIKITIRNFFKWGIFCIFINSPVLNKQIYDIQNRCSVYINILNIFMYID